MKMKNSKNSVLKKNNETSLFINYKPAELRKGKDWLIIYYAKNPISQKMERFRLRVPKLSNIKDREKTAKKMCDEINKRLQGDWLPYFESQETFYAKFQDCCDIFIKRAEIEVDRGNKRADTLRAYRSHISVINKFLQDKNYKVEFIFDFNKTFCVKYLDYLFFDRNCSNTTYNNHLGFLRNFSNWLIQQDYIKENPCKTIEQKAKQAKRRQVFPNDLKTKLKDYIEKNTFSFYVLMMTTYYCMIRRTELTKIKVIDVILFNNTIVVNSTVSKNKKSEIVSIPEPLSVLLAKHLQYANNDDYLFSDNNFLPGKKQLSPKKISDFWDKIRVKLELPKEYQFYSLKDTGITDLLEAGLPAIKVRNQARHYDIKITEMYTPRLQRADDDVVKSKVFF